MYKVIISDSNYDTVHDYTGCISFRISDSGTVSAEFYTGVNKIYKMKAGDNIEKIPMTDEEILSTPGLGEWYKEAMEAQEKASQEATD